MHIKPNKNRLMRLNLREIVIGDKLLFCPKCLWQAPEPDIGMKNECPDCSTSLHETKVDQDLFDLNVEFGTTTGYGLAL